jgi:XTP/dITP diphosphohydrolase
MTTIYAATTNAGKLREFAECARGEGVEVLALPGLKEMPAPVEDAATFMGNAELKAVAYSRLAAGVLVMADDSGLEVEGLGGAPGVRSARFAEDAGAGSGDEANNRLLLERMAKVEKAAVEKQVPLRGMERKQSEADVEAAAEKQIPLRGMEERKARFVCALAVARDGVVLWRAEGFVEGEILREGRGENGFGYDPLFYVAELGRTAAELGAEEKWRVSHRGRAFRELLRGMG